MSGILSKADTMEPAWVGDVLRFWFAELSEAKWFGKDDALDAQIRERFGSLHERLMADDGCSEDKPRHLLAAVIVMDQFSRNMFRASARSYLADAKARSLSRKGVQQRLDAAMSMHERLFLYLPFEHSEDLGDQTLSVDLIGAIGNPAWTQDALAHKAIIERFGRFPHRNAVLGRESTADELELLAKPQSWF
jgi:uncharacterized protein (DUF924 family)